MNSFIGGSYNERDTGGAIITADKKSQLAVGEDVGVCVRDKDNIVVHQNAKCRAYCGHMHGRVCETGCQAKSTPAEVRDKKYLEIKDVFPTDETVNALLFNEQDTQVTLLFDMTPFVGGILKQLEPCGLTGTETDVTRLVLSGHRNQEIAKRLGIGRATVKTHLNNIYKKIPPQVKLLMQAKRMPTKK